MSNEITLSPGQSAALSAFMSFLLDPDQPVFVLAGYAGTGKSTLVKHLLDSIPNIMKTIHMVNPKFMNMSVEVTATTNKAADVLGRMTGYPVTTIHSFLGLSVHKDYTTGQTTLVDRQRKEFHNTLVFIDEASFIDSKLLETICIKLMKCKIVFIGDPAQLTPVKATHTPVFNAKFPTASLTEVMRQAAGNPIIALATKFRETVNTGKFFQFTPDNAAIKWLNTEDFKAEVDKEFLDPTWHYNRSKILAWTNKRVQQYNQYVAEQVKTTAEFQEGDFCVNNQHISIGNFRLATDEIVFISRLLGKTTMHGITGTNVEVNHQVTVFVPDSWKEVKKKILMWRELQEYNLIAMADKWADLRAMYACTVNKSQGSTFDRVFIDLSDIAKCNNGNTIARMLYVAVTRARHEVILTGDIA